MPSVLDALADDLNSPLAVSHLMKASDPKDLVATLNFLGLVGEAEFSYARQAREQQRHGIHDAVERAVQKALEDDARAIGIEPELLSHQISERLAAFANKDFATADRIRAELAEQGIALMDSKDPETGERRTKWEIKR